MVHRRDMGVRCATYRQVVHRGGRVVDGQTMINDNVIRAQYRDDPRLAARQALWRLRSGPSLYDIILDLAALRGTEVIVDVGCGNGAYLAELRLRWHARPVLGVDLAEAMAR
jgi:SAM-dependent methyltransferase